MIQTAATVRRVPENCKKRDWRKWTERPCADNRRAREFYRVMGFAPDGATKMLDLSVPLKAVRYGKQIGGQA